MICSLVLTAHPLSSDSRLRLGSGREWAAAIFAWLLAVLALDPVRDLVQSVDRMPIRSLLKLGRLGLATGEHQAAAMEPQPDSAWTINRQRRAPTPIARSRVSRRNELRALGSNEHTLSRAPCVAESPAQRISAMRDETRAIDQCGATRDARRDSGGRRAS